MKRTYIISAFLLLIIVLAGRSLGIFLFAQENAQKNNTVFKALELYPNFETISVYGLFEGDANKNNATELSYRKPGEEEWRKGHPLDLLPGGRWVGTLFWLTPDTEYEVKVQFQDPDGAEPKERVKKIKTRSDKWPEAAGKTYYVSAEKGNDTADGSKGSPFKTTLFGSDLS